MVTVVPRRPSRLEHRSGWRPILAAGGGSYGLLYTVAGLCAVLGAFAILPVRRVR